MAYRNGTYVAFAADGATDITTPLPRESFRVVLLI
jgi:hypothetical protein